MTKNYARLADRVKAAFIDTVILVALMYTASDFLTMFEEVTKPLRWTVFIIVVYLYDPLLTYFFGATLGQSFCKISVRRENNSDKNLPLHRCFLRFFFKATLGWISLLTITGNEKRKALHDFIAKSVVIEVPEEEEEEEEESE